MYQETPSRILENLYLGSQACCDKEILSKYKITHILSVGVPSFIDDPKIKKRYIIIEDSSDANLTKILPECLEFMREALAKSKHNLLVHCIAGISRSASVVIAYLMLEHNYTYIKAISYVKAKRSIIAPNPGFVRQLKMLENRN